MIVAADAGEQALEAQRKFSDSVIICSLSFSLHDKYDKDLMSEEKEIGM